MYNLCKIDRSACNGSILGHPVNVVERSEVLEIILESIKERVLNGCPSEDLLIFKDVEFECSIDVDVNIDHRSNN